MQLKVVAVLEYQGMVINKDKGLHFEVLFDFFVILDMIFKGHLIEDARQIRDGVE